MKFPIFYVLLRIVMKIVIDDKIPYIRPAIEELGVEARYIKGADICAADVKDADAMIVRTRTHCDQSLLEGSSVKFIATATIGFDHIDTAYLQEAGISWTNCPGCNAASVGQYLRSVLLLLQENFSLPLTQSTVGIVGCGHVGSEVLKVARELGMHILVCDPLIKPVPGVEMADMGRIEQEADVITFHVPLTFNGPCHTWHLADKAFMERLRRKPFIINTSRGEVVDNVALLQALEEGTIKQAVIDTWENEPHISLPLLHKVYIGTPHIAGYSADGKVNADNMVIDALCGYFHLKHPHTIIPPALPADFEYDGDPLQLYNPLTDSHHLKEHPELFEDLRGNYPVRRESV